MKSLQNYLKFGLAILALIAAAGIPMLAAAQGLCDQDEQVAGVCLPSNPSGVEYDNVVDVLELIISIALSVVGLIAVIFLIYGGYRYITAGANEDGVTSAKTIIKNALIGLIVVILAYALVVLVVRFIQDPATSTTADTPSGNTQRTPRTTTPHVPPSNLPPTPPIQ